MKKQDANRYRIFISSVQKELTAERRALKDFITHDPLIAEPLYRVKYVEKAGTGTTGPLPVIQTSVPLKNPS